MAPKQTAKKKTNIQKKKIKEQNQARMKENGAVQDEIILVVMLVISVLLFLSNFDLSGPVGNFISSFTFGMVGLEAYILPFILFFMTAFYISNIGNIKAGRKLLSAYVFFIALAAFIQMVTTPYNSETNIFDYYNGASDNRSGGGIIGGILVMLLCGLFDTVATYVILIAVMIVSIIVITGKAIFTYLAKKSKSTYHERKEYQKLKMEQQEENPPVTKQADWGRRPPKTFLLDPAEEASKVAQAVKNSKNMQEPKDTISTLKAKALEKDSLINLKDRKQKKDNSLEELPVLDFHKLFEENQEPSDPTKTSSETSSYTTVSSYEEELRNKFGSVEPEIKEKQP